MIFIRSSIRQSIRPILVIFLLHPISSYAGEVIELERVDLRQLLDIPIVRVTTGTQKTLAKAPAIASVITAREMEELGIRYLYEALDTIPGLYVGGSYAYFDPNLTIRGISTSSTRNILFLINGINYSRVVRNIPVKMIQRIEIIRGPGSALYGADAFTGVVNIITKQKDAINGTQLGVTGGTFDTYQGWLLHGDKYGPIDTALGLEFTTTQGHREIIDQDQQTAFDSVTGTSASLAPGPMKNMNEFLRTNIDLEFKKWDFNAYNQYTFERGNGAGPSGALVPVNQSKRSETGLALTYYDPLLTPNWSYKASVSSLFTQSHAEKPIMLFPPGSDIPPSGGTFQNGVLLQLGGNSSRKSLETSANYRGFPFHIFTIGAFLHYDQISDLVEIKNFDSATFTPLPGGLREVTSPDERTLENTNRTNYGAYLQDQWLLSNDWEMTAGVRFDHFTQFGETINPRLALVWDIMPGLHGKLLYGKAFRAPSIDELHLKNNPTALGNPDLKPESIQSYEMGLDYHASRNTTLRLNLFYNQAKDLIDFRTTSLGRQAVNEGELDSKGFEAEAIIVPTNKWKMSVQYSFSQARTKPEKSHLGIAPLSEAYLKTHWYMMPSSELNLSLNWKDSIKRTNTDPRPNVDSYLLTNITFHKKNILPQLNFIFSCLNIFDKHYRLPSPGPSTLGAAIPIPNDLPQEGRSFYVGFETQL